MSAPCLVCGDLHDPPMCQGEPSAQNESARLVSMEITATFYRGLLKDLVLAIETGEGFPAALRHARRGLGRSE